MMRTSIAVFALCTTVAFADFGNNKDPIDTQASEKESPKETVDDANGNGKIVGGVDADPSKNKWMVQLMLRREFEGSAQTFMCAASMIAPDLALTAAHCFYDDQGNDMEFDFGASMAYIGLYSDSDKYSETPTHLTRSIGCVKVHPQWDYTMQENDIAVIHFTESVPSDWPTVVLDFPSNAGIDRQSATAFGWGSLLEADSLTGDILPDHLQEVEMDILSNTACNSISATYQSLIKETMLCTYTEGKDACSGDSGGPLVIDVGGSAIQIGIISWGVGCARMNSPGVYTRVASYTEWVADQMVYLSENNGCTNKANEIMGGAAARMALSVGGCQCSFAWAVGSGTCPQVESVVFNGCGMKNPCDGDDNGVAGLSWCILDTIDGCKPAGSNWDYCAPEDTNAQGEGESSTSSSSSTSSTATSSTTTTEVPDTPAPTPTPTPPPTPSPVILNTASDVQTLDEYIENRFRVVTTTKVCDPDKAERCSTIGLPGRDTTPEECADYCETLFDCYWAALNSGGRCTFFTKCPGSQRLVSDNSYLFKRLTTPTTQAPSITEGYTLEGESQWCDREADGFLASKRERIGGSGHSLETCVDACEKRMDCYYFSYQPSGVCHLYEQCPKLTATDEGTLMYSRDPYKMVSTLFRCDKNQIANFQAIGGSGQTREECQARCNSWIHCSHVVWYSLKGYCHQFSECPEDKQIDSQGGSQILARTNGAEVPIVGNYEITAVGHMCDRGSPLTINAVLGSLGKGNTVYQCQEGCDNQPSCNFMVWYTLTGYCHMYSECPVTNPKTAIIYTKQVEQVRLASDGSN